MKQLYINKKHFSSSYNFEFYAYLMGGREKSDEKQFINSKE